MTIEERLARALVTWAASFDADEFRALPDVGASGGSRLNDHAPGWLRILARRCPGPVSGRGARKLRRPSLAKLASQPHVRHHPDQDLQCRPVVATTVMGPGTT